MTEKEIDDALATMDAQKWAKAFIHLFENRKDEIDHELMTSWFANAIMRGYDKGAAFKKSEIDQIKLECGWMVYGGKN